MLCSLLLSGCGLIDEYFLPTPEDTVQEVFEAGSEAMRDKDYPSAIKYYTRIKDEYPFSPYAIESELSDGDAYFLNEDYWQAVDAYRDFETLHPRHEAIPYVLYQKGMSLKNTYTSIDHSATELNEAIESFTRLAQEFPDTEYGKKAPSLIAECRKTLAQRELFIANVFWGMENYQSAWTRYQYVLRNFPDVKEEAEYARTKGEAAYLRYRQQNADDIRETQEGSWKSWLRSWL